MIGRLGCPLFVAGVVLALVGSASGARPLPKLEATGIGSVQIGASRPTVVARLRLSLGSPNAVGINTGCGKSLTEVAWHDLIAEFRNGRFSGYRFILGGWPLTTVGSPRDRVTTTGPFPALHTTTGLTLGSTLAQLRDIYRHRLRRTGTSRWTSADGLTFTEPSTVVNTTAPDNKIVEIQANTCGDF